MHKKQAFEILWREWASSEFEDREYLLYLFRQLSGQRGGGWGATVLGLVLLIWSLLALAPFSLLVAGIWCLYNGNMFHEIFFDGLRILIHFTIAFAVLGIVAGCFMPWKRIFTLVRACGLSGFRTYFGVFALAEDEDNLIRAGVAVVIAVLIGIWGGISVAVGEAIIVAGAYSMIPIIVVGMLWHSDPSDGLLDIRRACLWWRFRQDPSQVEQALNVIADAEVLAELTTQRVQTEDLDESLADLSSSKWQARWHARRVCIRHGGIAARKLVRSNDSSNWKKAHPYATNLIKVICRDTTTRYRCGRYLCPNCCCDVIRQRIHDWSFYGCRACGRSLDVLRVPGPVVCSLERQSPEIFHRQGKEIYVNWFALQQLPDFDRVEVIDAVDQEVESFVIAIRNATDNYCRRRYARATCSVHHAVTLGENSLRMLRQTFREVRTRPTSSQRPVMIGSIGGT